MNNAYSPYSDILYGVPLGSILGIRFNVYISDMFYGIDNCDIANYAMATHHTPVTINWKR